MRASIRTSGASLLLGLIAACYGFAGGGFPGHVRTVAIVPFENETPVAELTREVNDELRKGLQSRLGDARGRGMLPRPCMGSTH